MQISLSSMMMAVLLLVVAVISPSRAQTSQAVTELDPGISIAFDITKRFKLDLFVGREKSDELSSGKTKASIGASFRAKPLFKGFRNALDADKQHVLVIGATYEYSHAAESGAITNEHRVMLDATGRYAFFYKLLTSDRNRFEFRWVNGSYRFRYRNRFMIERPVAIRKLELTPYGSAEAYWDGRYGKWSQFKFTAGVQIPFIRRSSVDLYYERQHCVTCADSQTNIYGITLNLYLRRKK